MHITFKYNNLIHMTTEFSNPHLVFIDEEDFSIEFSLTRFLVFLDPPTGGENAVKISVNCECSALTQELDDFAKIHYLSTLSHNETPDDAEELKYPACWVVSDWLEKTQVESRDVVEWLKNECRQGKSDFLTAFLYHNAQRLIDGNVEQFWREMKISNYINKFSQNV